MRNYFEKFSKIKTTEVMEDKHSRRKRGFAFTIFDHIVDKIIVQGYSTIHGPNEVKTHKPSMKTQAVPMTFLVTEIVSFEMCSLLDHRRSWGRSGNFRCCGELLPWWRVLCAG